MKGLSIVVQLILLGLAIYNIVKGVDAGTLAKAIERKAEGRNEDEKEKLLVKAKEYKYEAWGYTVVIFAILIMLAMVSFWK